MQFPRIILIIAVILAIFILIKSVTSKNEVPVQNGVTQEEQMQNESASKDEKKEPNALDVIAPGYGPAQKKVQTVQELRQQAIQEEQELMNNNM